MDFIIVFSMKSRQHDSIMVMIDRLKKVAHFIRVKPKYSANDVTQVFIRDVIRLHCVQKKIVPNNDVKFTSRFWK